MIPPLQPSPWLPSPVALHSLPWDLLLSQLLQRVLAAAFSPSWLQLLGDDEGQQGLEKSRVVILCIPPGEHLIAF